MQPISASINVSVPSMNAASSANMGNVTSQPAVGAEGANGAKTVGALQQVIASQAAAISVRDMALSFLAMMIDKPDDKDKNHLGILMLQSSSFNMNTTVLNVNMGGYDGAGGGVGGAGGMPAGMSINFSA